METIKNIAAILGLLLSFAAVCTLCSKTLKGAIASIFKKYGNDESLKKILDKFSDFEKRIETLTNSFKAHEESGEKLRQELKVDIEEVCKKLNDHIEEQEAERANRSRRHILAFADRLYNDEKPSIEYTANMVEDCNIYEEFCKSHPNYPNSKAKAAIAAIRSYYTNITTIES